MLSAFNSNNVCIVCSFFFLLFFQKATYRSFHLQHTMHLFFLPFRITRIEIRWWILLRWCSGSNKIQWEPIWYRESHNALWFSLSFYMYIQKGYELEWKNRDRNFFKAIVRVDNLKKNWSNSSNKIV